MIDVGTPISKMLVDSRLSTVSNKLLDAFEEIDRLSKWFTTVAPDPDDNSNLTTAPLSYTDAGAQKVRDVVYALTRTREVSTGITDLPAATDFTATLREIAGPGG